MAGPYIRTVTTTGVSTPILWDTFQGSGNIAFGCVVTATPVVYTVEHSFDPIRVQPGNAGYPDADQGPTNWFADASVSNKTTSALGTLLGVPQWSRLNVSGAGAVTMTAYQPGSGT